jgi:hydroxyacylglutathione hydrolase
MIVKCLAVGSMAANCYLVWCETTKEALIIDPGGEGRRILAEVDREQLQVKYVVNTHGHVDHIAANFEVCDATGATLMIHEADASLLADPGLNLSSYVGGALPPLKPGALLHEGDEIACGEQVRLKVLHTPGHTRGGISLQAEGIVFTGDTLFADSVGRTDFPGGSWQSMIDSIKGKLLTLGDDTVVYPGHGPSTTIGHERKHNPFL